jgi:hypothetical protein
MSPLGEALTEIGHHGERRRGKKSWDIRAGPLWGMVVPAGLPLLFYLLCFCPSSGGKGHPDSELETLVIGEYMDLLWPPVNASARALRQRLVHLLATCS